MNEDVLLNVLQKDPIPLHIAQMVKDTLWALRVAVVADEEIDRHKAAWKNEDSYGSYGEQSCGCIVSIFGDVRSCEKYRYLKQGQTITWRLVKMKLEKLDSATLGDVYV